MPLLVICFLISLLVWDSGAPLYLYLLHEYKQRLAIVLPLLRQLTLMRKFVTTHIHRQLKAIGVQIAEIIHTCQEKERAEAGRIRSEFRTPSGRICEITSGFETPIRYYLFVCELLHKT